jgi:NADH-quinone oxidoreductase subunit L
VLLVIGALCLFAGVTSKSGQFPLHTWLPDAMAGPTPVSALIHAATMVVAGVYLIARLYGVFFSGLHIGSGILFGHDPSTYLNWVAIAAGLTTLVGGTLAFVQHDLKKVLAYSTVSQLGYMVLGLGVGAWTGAVFHLFTHAMFKACLFLGAGSVSHACHHTFDMREMGGLRKKMPVTFYTFVVGSAALAGIPLLSGFWSKDEILAGALQNGYYPILAMGITTALLTAAYTTRAVYLTFFGEYRGHAHPHESPKVITVPLVILAAFAFVLVLANIPKFGEWVPGAVGLRFEHFVQPTFAFPPEGAPPAGLPVVAFSVPLALISVVLAVAGIAGMWWYQTSNAFRGLTAKVGPMRAGYTLLVNKYYLDVLYTDIIVGFTKGALARASYWVNMNIIDKVVNAFGVTARYVGGFVYRFLDQGLVDRVVNFSGQASEESGQFLRRSQSGKVQEYASLLFGSAVVFVIALVLVIQLSA